MCWHEKEFLTSQEFLGGLGTARLRVRGNTKIPGLMVLFCFLKVTVLLAPMRLQKLGLMNKEVLSCPACLSHVDSCERIV